MRAASAARLALPLALLAMTPGEARAPTGVHPRPGLWRMTRMFVELRLPGVSQAFVRDRIGKPHRMNQCVTKEAADSFYGPAEGEGCRFTRSAIGGGRVSAIGTCSGGRMELYMMLAPERVSGIATKVGSDGSFLKARIQAERIGACPAARGRTGP